MDSNFQIIDDSNKIKNKNENIINDAYYISNEDTNIFFNLTKHEILKYQLLLKYSTKKTILNDKNFLGKIIDELILLIKADYGNILFPFLSPPCHKLLEAYIESNLDEEENIKSIKDFKYIKIFEVMKDNTFISRENVSLIYSYFGSLFLDAKEIKQDDKRLLKFLKLKELWKIFYTLPKDLKNKNRSNFSFIGGKLIFKVIGEYDFVKRNIFIKINFQKPNKYLNKFLDKIAFLKINSNKITEINKILKNVKGINNISFIEFRIHKKKIDFFYQIIGKEIKSEIINFDLKEISNITLLENYYGQVNSIEINLRQNTLNGYNHSLIFYPIPITETNNLCCIKNFIKKDNDKTKNENQNIIDLTTINKKIFDFKIDNTKLIKVNYINYNENNYNIIEYFGGITQLLPFMSLINNLFENNKIKEINSQNKNDILISFATDILYIFFNIIFHYKEYKKNIEKYSLFFFCIINELNYLLLSEKQLIISFLFNLMGREETKKFGNTFSDLIKILSIDKTGAFNNYNFIVKENEKIIDNFHYFYRQLYSKLMKELFIYNRNWSKKELFFNLNKNEKQISIKYKQLNYYTKSFQQPFIYPILEMEKYYPNFNEFEKENLYKNKEEKILNYDFSLSDNNIIFTEIKEYLSKNPLNNIDFEKCCLIKKLYHVKGKIGILKKIERNNESFEIIFISNEKEEDYTCNKEIKNDDIGFKLKIREKMKNACYGSIFKCPKREYDKKIIIKSEDIIFILIREYFHRVSGIEFFTNNNKSYYFNFNKKFDVKKSFFSFLNKHSNENQNNNINTEEDNKNEDENIIDEENDSASNISIIDLEKTIIRETKNKIILNFFNRKNDFESIFRNKTLLGFYNKNYRKCFYPLFEKKTLSSNDLKNKYFSNYDLLIIINLLSNRSFKDLYQYPVFPMFYDVINKKRIMNKHIGLQELDSQSITRLSLINESYNSLYEDYIDNNNPPTPLCLFNTHYSNPIYVSNYLIRVFPYSFSCIELQGDGFDNPNRLFYAIDCCMINTLNQKSDLRELIPEIFYFYELFINRNGFQFYQLANKKDIDDVKIDINKENENKNDIYKFIADMRNLLEKEEKLNEWIDLIFGTKSIKDENNRNYYSKNTLVTFENKDEILNNTITMESTDFGLTPYKLFDSNFKISKKDNIEKLKIYNGQMVEKDHFIDETNPLKCFMCIGRAKIDKDYINLCQNKKIIENYLSQLKDVDEYYYYFVGDIFGNITIYKIFEGNNNKNDKGKILKRKSTHSKSMKNINEKIFENNNDCKEFDDNDDKNEEIYKAKIDRLVDDHYSNVIIFNKINDHHKQIKYIDFNGRLNLFLTYALDGFINLYLFPSCKLVNSFKVTNVVGKCIFEQLLLISTPFPMIICKNDFLLYIFDINGNYIHVEAIADIKGIQIHIDKNCGIVQDFLSKEGKEYSFPFINEIKNFK